MSTEIGSSFHDVLPRLIAEYGLARTDLTPEHPLVDQANRLTPAFVALSEMVWHALPSKVVSADCSHKDLVQLTSISASALAEKQREVRNFAESICFESIELRVRGEHVSEAKASAIRAAREPLVGSVQQVTRPIEPVITAELVARPVNEIAPVVNAWLRESCHTVAAQLLLSMHVLVELDVVGLVEWPSDTTCKLNFFKHIIVQDQVRTTETQRVRRRRGERGERLVRFETWEQQEGRNRYAIQRHEHHVMNASLRTIDEAQFPIPAEKRAFLSKQPDWIRQQLRILEGDLIMEKVIEREVLEEKWVTTPTLRTAYELEPAIVLGHYVITGWGLSDINREKNRQRRIETTKATDSTKDHERKIESRDREIAGRIYSQFNLWVFPASACSIAMMLFSRFQPSAMVSLSVLLSLVASCLAFVSSWHFPKWQFGSHDLIFTFAKGLAITSGVLAANSLLHGVLFGRLNEILFALVLGVLTMVSAAIYQSRVRS